MAQLLFGAWAPTADLAVRSLAPFRSHFVLCLTVVDARSSETHIEALRRRYSADDMRTCGGVIGTQRGPTFWTSLFAMNSDSDNSVTDAWNALDGGDWYVKSELT